MRLNSKEAREKLDQAGLKVHSRFDAFDTLETREDLEQLYDVLSSVKDANGKPAVFTPFALPCNIDFERMADEDYQAYYYENLPITFEKLSAQQPQAYEGTWQLWQEGLNKGLLQPQFHGREHFNLKVFEEKLKRRDHDIIMALQTHSYTSIEQQESSNIEWTAAFSFNKTEELKRLAAILQSGLDAFESVFGYRANGFTPPAQHFHPDLYSVIYQFGIRGIDRPFLFKQHQGEGKYTWNWESTRMDKKAELVKWIRNVVFEPSNSEESQVEKAMRQIETAFRWKKPAIISSHRVNFCGHIDPKNRSKGLNSLRELLKKIVTRWPDVEFIGIGEFVRIIERDS